MFVYRESQEMSTDRNKIELVLSRLSTVKGNLN